MRLVSGFVEKQLVEKVKMLEMMKNNKMCVIIVNSRPIKISHALLHSINKKERRIT